MPLHILIYKKNANSHLKKKNMLLIIARELLSLFSFTILKSLTFQNPLPSLIAPHPPNPPLAPAQATTALAQETAAPHLLAALPLNLLPAPPIHQLPSTAPLSFWVSPSPLSLFISLLSLSSRIFSLEYEYMCV